MLSLSKKSKVRLVSRVIALGISRTFPEGPTMLLSTTIMTMKTDRAMCLVAFVWRALKDPHSSKDHRYDGSVICRCETKLPKGIPSVVRT